uniref:Uncharacterized protein n=1 Tax=Populus trichocarpa TaxID=3694 RepID=A0A2K2AR67_POPTR
MLSIGFLQGTLLLVSGYSPISCDKLLCRQACVVVRSCLFFPQPRISFRSVCLTCLILVIGSKLPSKSRQALCKYNKIRLLRG